MSASLDIPDWNDTISSHSEEGTRRPRTVTREAVPWVLSSRRTAAETSSRSEVAVERFPSSLAVQASVPQEPPPTRTLCNNRKHRDPEAHTASLLLAAPDAHHRGSPSEPRKRGDRSSQLLPAHRRVRARAVDGGLTLAGGRGIHIVGDVDDGRSSSAGSTLPPPYGTY